VVRRLLQRMLPLKNRLVSRLFVNDSLCLRLTEITDGDDAVYQISKRVQHEQGVRFQR
jgi:hypothetical protein